MGGGLARSCWAWLASLPPHEKWLGSQVTQIQVSDPLLVILCTAIVSVLYLCFDCTLISHGRSDVGISIANLQVKK